MQILNLVISNCRNCQYYSLEGRRGGQCQRLGVPVRGDWKACQLAISPFAPSWERLEEMMWQEETVDLQSKLVPDRGLRNCEELAPLPKHIVTIEAVTAQCLDALHTTFKS